MDGDLIWIVGQGEAPAMKEEGEVGELRAGEAERSQSGGQCASLPSFVDQGGEGTSSTPAALPGSIPSPGTPAETTIIKLSPELNQPITRLWNESGAVRGSLGALVGVICRCGQFSSREIKESLLGHSFLPPPFSQLHSWPPHPLQSEKTCECQWDLNPESLAAATPKTCSQAKTGMSTDTKGPDLKQRAALGVQWGLALNVVGGVREAKLRVGMLGPQKGRIGCGDGREEGREDTSFPQSVCRDLGPSCPPGSHVERKELF
ncbi:Sodium/Hydrogen Exchanger 5 [Manis pentadactyla]|nr:Sodium/Hydrogen Exchanger 5 [Manis pentadactyla]